MTQSFLPDLTQFPLTRLRARFESGDVLPSRIILTEAIPERFAALEAMGIEHLHALIEALKTKKKAAAFAKASGLSEEYCTILGREARSYIPKPLRLADIPDTLPEHTDALAAAGLKNSFQLLEHGATPESRHNLAADTGVPEPVIRELVAMADIARAGYVGPVYARLLYDAGVRDAAHLAECEPETLHESLNEVIARRGENVGVITRKDVEKTIADAADIHPVVSYE